MTLSNSMSITPSSPPRPRGKGSNMGQFSVEKPVAPGSVLSGNQQTDLAQQVDVTVDHFTDALDDFTSGSRRFPSRLSNVELPLSLANSTSRSSHSPPDGSAQREL